MAETKKKAAPKASPVDEFAKAVDKARKAGLTVSANVTEMDDDGVSTTHSF